MKIQTSITTIECSAEELRQSNSLSDAFYNAFRNALNTPFMAVMPEDKPESENEE